MVLGENPQNKRHDLREGNIKIEKANEANENFALSR